MRVADPHDPRLEPFIRLRDFMPLPGGDREAGQERKMLRRVDLREAVRK